MSNIGKQSIDRVILNLGLINADSDINQIYELIMQTYKLNNIDDLHTVFENENAVSNIASIAKEVIEFAEKGNDLALSIVQEATRNIGEYIISNLEKLNYKNKLGLRPRPDIDLIPSAFFFGFFLKQIRYLLIKKISQI